MNHSTRTNAITAVFKDRSSAETAKQQLVENGFNSDEIEVSSIDDLVRYVGSGNTGLSGTHHDHSGGGISGFFSRLFGMDTTEDDRRYYSAATRRGNAAVVVHADESSIDRASDILNECGAVEVEEGAELSGHEWSESNVPTSNDEGTIIPVVREDINVGKRAVQRRGVRIHSTVNERPVEEQVQLREERVRVDRRPADRPATDADFDAADRDVIEIHETVEEPVINKNARVVEEVVVSKDVGDRTETVRDTVQHSDVHVEDARRDPDRVYEEPGYRKWDSSDDTEFRNDFRTRYGATGSERYEDYEPAYRYGYEMANDSRYRRRRFEDVEDTLRTDYLRRNPNSAWDRAKGAVRYSWEKVTGKR